MGSVNLKGILQTNDSTGFLKKESMKFGGSWKNSFLESQDGTPILSFWLSISVLAKNLLFLFFNISSARWEPKTTSVHIELIQLNRSIITKGATLLFRNITGIQVPMKWKTKYELLFVTEIMGFTFHVLYRRDGCWFIIFVVVSLCCSFVAPSYQWADHSPFFHLCLLQDS